jgi:hypothetical protein
MYRKEALEARGKPLSGQVILLTPPSWWLITLLLGLTLGLILWGLLTLSVSGQPLWQFIAAQFSRPS